MNWYRLAFIFLPAAIRGDIMYLSFFLPFLFGPILQRVVRTFVTLYDKTDNIKVFHAAALALACPAAGEAPRLTLALRPLSRAHVSAARVSPHKNRG